ncbi:unnamed protein product, partial [Allacma fusca]
IGSTAAMAFLLIEKTIALNASKPGLYEFCLSNYVSLSVVSDIYPQPSAFEIVVVYSLAVLTFAMAIILLCGSHNGNTSKIDAWMICCVICLVVWTTKIIFDLFFTPWGYVLLLYIAILVFVFVIRGFCLWVLGIHKKEIEASARSVSQLRLSSV